VGRESPAQRTVKDPLTQANLQVKATSAEDGTFQGVVDSYEVAQREIEEEGGEQRVGEYRVRYIIEPAEG
jgi:hypothetical protein